MISRKRVRDFNKILTCLLCKGYLIEATTINTCMHSFCRSCVSKHVKLYEQCPTCETEIRLGNLRPDIRLRSIIYKIIPGLYAKERQKKSEDSTKIILNGTSGAHPLVKKCERQLDDICIDDEMLLKQYFYDPEEPISLSLEYHMESIFGSNVSLSNNIPQVRYLQAPAAFKVHHLKKFLSSKYDLSNLKKPMCIDIIYEGEILSEEFTLMDIAYTFSWEREAPLKLFYRIYKSKKYNNNSNDVKLIEKALINQPFVKLSSDECRKIMEPNGSNNKSKVSGGRENAQEREVLRRNDAPRHDLKIIIAKKFSGKNKISYNSGKKSSNKERLNKPNSNSSRDVYSGSSSKILNDFERLRGNVDNFSSSASSSEIASTSGMKATLSKKTGTVSHHDLKLENKSNTKRHNNNNDSHDFYEFTMNEEREKEKQKRESMKHTNSSSSLSYSVSHSSKPQYSTSMSSAMGRNDQKFKVKSSLSSNIPKLKIELPSLKTKITVPKTPNESYCIAKSPFSNISKSEPQLKKVRFDMSNTTYSSSPSYKLSSNNNRSLYDFEDDSEENSYVDQKKYAEKIGLKPVERKVESIILHRKRKKSKHSKDIEHSSKRPKLHVSSSLDESLKLKLKIMGGKNCKNDKKINEDETYERTCNLKAVHCKTADLSSINVHEVKQHKKQHEQQERQKDVEVELENHKYSVTEQKITKTSSFSSDSNQPMVFIPKLVLQKATTTTNVSTFTLSTSPTSSSSSPSMSLNNKKEETNTQVQRRNSIFSDREHKMQQQQKQEHNQSQEENKARNVIKIKIKPLDKLASDPSNQKLMKPPTAKMGSPCSDIQAQISSTLASSPIRPNSIPASLKLSPISPSYALKNDFQNFKRSLSTGAEISPHCYINPYAKSNMEMFTREPPLVKIPPLIPTSQTIRNFYNATFSNNNNNNNNKNDQSRQAPVTISKVPNINVKDPMKLFPNACPSVEILKIPQAAPIVNQQHVVKNVKLNRQIPPTIPLVKIKETAQNQTFQKILPKPNQHHQNLIKMPNYHDQKVSLSLNDKYSGSGGDANNSYNVESCQSPISQTDLSLARYHFELSKDIAKLDHSLSLEKNFEDWMKKQEFSKLNFITSQPHRNIMNQQMNLSVRHIPNPSALMMFRNQNNNIAAKLNSSSKSPTSTTVSSPSRMVTSTTISEHPDIEEVISKSTISKGTEKPFFSENNNSNKFSVNNHSKSNDKKSIEKLTEYLRLTATAAKSKEIRNDDDNNNNNNHSPSSRNDKNFNLIDGNTIVGQKKSSSMDVICIDT